MAIFALSLYIFFLTLFSLVYIIGFSTENIKCIKLYAILSSLFISINNRCNLARRSTSNDIFPENILAVTPTLRRSNKPLWIPLVYQFSSTGCLKIVLFSCPVIILFLCHFNLKNLPFFHLVTPTH